MTAATTATATKLLWQFPLTWLIDHMSHWTIVAAIHSCLLIAAVVAVAVAIAAHSRLLIANHTVCSTN